jgi:hypothetical protein
VAVATYTHPRQDRIRNHRAGDVLEQRLLLLSELVRFSLLNVNVCDGDKARLTYCSTVRLSEFALTCPRELADSQHRLFSAEAKLVAVLVVDVG